MAAAVQEITVKYGKEQLSVVAATIGELRSALERQTGVVCAKQKLFGLPPKLKPGADPATALPPIKKPIKLVGTPEVALIAAAAEEERSTARAAAAEAASGAARAPQQSRAPQPPPLPPKRRAEYTHADGTVERVTVVKEHAESEGGGFTVFIPSLKRERQTVAGRLRLLGEGDGDGGGGGDGRGAGADDGTAARLQAASELFATCCTRLRAPRPDAKCVVLGLPDLALLPAAARSALCAAVGALVRRLEGAWDVVVWADGAADDALRAALSPVLPLLTCVLGARLRVVAWSPKWAQRVSAKPLSLLWAGLRCHGARDTLLADADERAFALHPALGLRLPAGGEGGGSGGGAKIGSEGAAALCASMASLGEYLSRLQGEGDLGALRHRRWRQLLEAATPRAAGGAAAAPAGVDPYLHILHTEHSHSGDDHGHDCQHCHAHHAAQPPPEGAASRDHDHDHGHGHSHDHDHGHHGHCESHHDEQAEESEEGEGDDERDMEEEQ